VTLSLRAGGLDAVVLDIEGTTTPLAFVHEALFPFARRALEPFVRAHVDRPEFAVVVQRLRAEWRNDSARGDAPPAWSDESSGEEQISSIVRYAQWLMESGP
jgi:enolase-phosphatase E1